MYALNCNLPLFGLSAVRVTTTFGVVVLPPPPALAFEKTFSSFLFYAGTFIPLWEIQFQEQRLLHFLFLFGPGLSATYDLSNTRDHVILLVRSLFYNSPHDHGRGRIFYFL